VSELQRYRSIPRCIKIIIKKLKYHTAIVIFFLSLQYSSYMLWGGRDGNFYRVVAFPKKLRFDFLYFFCFLFFYTLTTKTNKLQKGRHFHLSLPNGLKTRLVTKGDFFRHTLLNVPSLRSRDKAVETCQGLVDSRWCAFIF